MMMMGMGDGDGSYRTRTKRMTAKSLSIHFCVLLVTFWFSSSLVTVTAFVGVRPTTATKKLFLRVEVQSKQRRQRIGRRRSCHLSGSCISAKDDGNETGDDNIDDPLSNDRREGMADAFAALDSLTADDFDDLRPLLSSTAGSIGAFADSLSVEESAKLFMEMQAELSSLGGEDGVYGDILGDLEVGADSKADDDVDASKSFMSLAGENEVTSLGTALDEAVDLLAAADAPSDTFVLNDADGIGTVLSSDDNSDGARPLTTADVTEEILTQDIKPSLSMEEFISSAIQQAVIDIESSSEEMASASGVGRTEDIAKTTGELLENEELRREIGKIFDKAGERLRLEVETMKKEQEEVIQGASTKGLEYLEIEKQRISEAEESVTRLIQKVARETEQVQRAMEELELAKNQVSERGGRGGIEETALDLKKGGLIKQASLIGGLLFGSRAITELILVVRSPYGDEHFIPAVIQAVIALSCAAYFFLVK